MLSAAIHWYAAALLPFLDPRNLIDGFGAYALLGVCLIIFAETGLLVGFILPGDTLLVISGLLAHPTSNGGTPVIDIPVIWVGLAIGVAAFLGGEVGYLIGWKFGPKVFERKESGLFSRENVDRTTVFLAKWGALSIVLARWVPVVRTFAPVVAGVGHMPYRKYSLYNAIGAFLWGTGLTLFGWALGFFPPIANFVAEYIDIILLGAICIAIIPTGYHYIRATLKARRARAAEINESASGEPSGPKDR